VPKVPLLRSQRTPGDFRTPNVKATRELRRDPSYVPHFTNVPLAAQKLVVRLTAEEAAALDRLRLPVYGDDDGAALRCAMCSSRGGRKNSSARRKAARQISAARDSGLSTGGIRGAVPWCFRVEPFGGHRG
jgi:hypothetical protein